MNCRWAALGIMVSLALPSVAQDQAQAPAPENDLKIDWVTSPATVDLGREAQIKLDEGYTFANGADTRKIMTRMGNMVDNTEVGLVQPVADDQQWFLVFEYHAEGYIKDDDKDKIDADALLASIKEGTEAANKIRKERGIPGLHIIGWDEKPNYDSATHNLQWAIRAKSDDGGEVVNYQIRLLGRGGYMSATLVDDPAKMAQSKPQMKALLAGFNYKQGRTYAEWMPGDKVATYGLAALVAGGAGAAAAKLGLFGVLAKFIGKMGKAVILLIVAIGAGIKKLWEMLTGRSGERVASQQ
jgi:uncharacterized membrane-anchored protein